MAKTLVGLGLLVPGLQHREGQPTSVSACGSGAQRINGRHEERGEASLFEFPPLPSILSSPLLPPILHLLTCIGRTGPSQLESSSEYGSSEYEFSYEPSVTSSPSELSS